MKKTVKTCAEEYQAPVANIVRLSPYVVFCGSIEQLRRETLDEDDIYAY